MTFLALLGSSGGLAATGRRERADSKAACGMSLGGGADQRLITARSRDLAIGVGS